MAAWTNEEQTRMTIAALLAAVVKGLEATSPGLTDHVVKELQDTYTSMASWDEPAKAVEESIKWTSDFLRVPRN